jgi:undecaprenyl-diphosphatase
MSPAGTVPPSVDADGSGPGSADDPDSEGPTLGDGARAGVLAPLADLVRSVDDRVDAWFEPLRGNAALDGSAKLATGLGDYGVMWAATTAWRARHTGPERAQAVRALGIAGIESTVVNRALKVIIGRSRPDADGLRLTASGVPVREPTSSSFPSGHTLAAFCAVTVMSRKGDRSGNALLFAAATTVGISRLHLRAHHASDVIGGAAIGVALGLVGRVLL